MQSKKLFLSEFMLYPFRIVLQFLLKAYRWWNHFSSPESLPLEAPLEQRESVRRGQLTSKVLLIMLSTATFNLLTLFSALKSGMSVVYVGMFALLLLATFLNRRGKSTLAGFIVMMTIEVTLIWFILPFPDKLDMGTLPTFDFLVVPTLLAASLLPPKSVFPMALTNIVIIFVSILFLPKTSNFQALVTASPADMLIIPVMLQIIISGISFLWVRGSMQALKEADRADILDRLYREQARIAVTDAVTGLPNHRAIISYLQETLEQCEQTEEKCALLFVDLDHFKRINDTWGHLAGDTVLQEAGKRLQEALTAHGKVGRYGGEEFAVVLKGLDLPYVYQLAEKARIAIANTPCLWQGEGLTKEQEIMISASIGVAFYELHGSTDAALIESADQAMYQAKLQGRNCVRIAESINNTIKLNGEGEFLQLSMSA